jgi:DNA-binding helix-hairpin-helix protein with protein kinase domain
MSQKMISCTKSKFHGFYASDTECPWCDKKQQDETAKIKINTEDTNPNSHSCNEWYRTPDPYSTII